MALTAVLFDLDGTLWDSHPWFARLVAQESDGDETAALSALRSLHPAATMLRDAGVSEAGFRRLCSRSSPELYSEVEEVVAGLVDRAVPTGAVTNLPRWLAEP